MKEIGKIIKNKRIENNMTLEELSSITDISISTLSSLENGKLTRTKSIFLYRICNVLNLDYNDILRLRWEIFPTFLYEVI